MKTLHYYFARLNGIERIEKVNFAVNTEINTNFTELTDEQVSFLKKNPNASIHEVRKCKLNDVVTNVVEFDVNEYKAMKLKEISDLSLKTLGKFVSEYQLMNARLSIEAADDDKIYDDDKSRYYIDTYIRVGKQCRELYYSAVSDIEDAQTKEEVDQLYNQYNEQYGAID